MSDEEFSMKDSPMPVLLYTTMSKWVHSCKLVLKEQVAVSHGGIGRDDISLPLHTEKSGQELMWATDVFTLCMGEYLRVNSGTGRAYVLSVGRRLQLESSSTMPITLTQVERIEAAINELVPQQQ